MQDVEQRNHETFGSRPVSGDISVGDGEEQAEHVSERDAQERVSGIDGKGAETAADFDVRSKRAEPVAPDFDDAIEERKAR